MRRWGRVLLLLWSGSLTAVVAPRAAALDVRALPTVVPVWRQAQSAERLASRGETLYVKSGGELSALAVSSGRVLWRRKLGEGGCCTDDFLLTDRTVVLSAAGSLFFLNAKDGSTRSRLDLEGGISALAGPPVVALLALSDEVLAVDADSGQVTGRVTLEGAGRDLAVQEGVAIVDVETEEEAAVAVGYSADSLRPLWRNADPLALPQLARLAGKVYLQRLVGEGTESELLPLDPATGRLGPPLARRQGSEEPGWPQGIERLPGGEGERLRRVDPESGKTVWTAELPCQVEGAVRGGDSLYASCGRGGGRGLLAVLSWASGDLRQLAYGLPRGHTLLLTGDLLVVGSDDLVAAFSTTDWGPPEAGLDVEAEVRRILLDPRGDDTPFARGEPIEARVRDLAPLGPAAWPAIVRILPRLGPTSLVAAARALAAGGYRAGAPALAAQLARPLEEPAAEAAYLGWNPQLAILRALARLGGDGEVPVLLALLDNHERPASLRREALATLAALGSPAADRALRAFLARPAGPRQATWNPPPPPIGSDADGALSVDLPAGGRMVLFRHGYLGSPDDLWAVRLDRVGRPLGPSRFTGVRLPPDEDLPDPRARLAGGRVEVRDGAGRLAAVFRPADLTRDSDGDGLPDLVERRLGLDPERADSDGDGLPDGADPAPNARIEEPADAGQEIALVLFRELFRFDGGAGEIAVVVDDTALEWRGRRDLTITLNEREAERFLAETRGGGVPLVRFCRGEPAVVTPLSGDPPGDPPPPARDEEVYTVSVERGRGRPTIVYRVVVRNLNAFQPAAHPLWAIRAWRPVLTKT